MDEQTQTPQSSASKCPQSNDGPDDARSARETLLNESRSTANQQLAQITRLDDTAVRTVRISFLLLGVVAGGSRLSPFPNLGLVGAFGTWSLVGSLFAGLFVYGNSRLFLGPSPAELTVDYDSDPAVKRTHVELISEYDDGIRFNRSILHLNGVTLLVARSLLALAVVAFVLGVVRYYEPLAGGVVSTVQTFINLYSQI